MKLLIKCIAIAMSVTLLSCGRANNKNEIGETQDVALNRQMDQANSSGVSADSTAVAGEPQSAVLQGGQPAANIDWDKKIIKTADVTLELKDYNAFNSSIHGNTKRYGAYISAEQQNESDSKIENTISIKVPVDRFEDLMNALPSEGVKVVEKRISTEDVTGELVDTKARIEARKQVRDRYLDLLKQAKTMKEILAVQKEVNSIQEDIESGSGRVEFLGHQSAYSTINLTYYQFLTPSGGNDTEPPSFITKAKAAFKDGSSIVSGLLLVLVTFWPLIIAALVIWYFVKRNSLKTAIEVKKQA